jgi:Domain of unknown function (DUF4365)
MALAQKKPIRRKRRTREHVIADLSANHVERQALLCGHSIERRAHDYGIDLVLFTYDSTGEVENGEVLIQLKATDHLKTASGGQQVTFRVDRADLLAWLQEPMPVVLVVYDAPADAAYWLYVQGYFASGSQAAGPKGKTETVTVRIPRTNVLDQAAIQQFRVFRDRILAQAAEQVRHHE